MPAMPSAESNAPNAPNSSSRKTLQPMHANGSSTGTRPNIHPTNPSIAGRRGAASAKSVASAPSTLRTKKMIATRQPSLPGKPAQSKKSDAGAEVGAGRRGGALATLDRLDEDLG